MNLRTLLIIPTLLILAGSLSGAKPAAAQNQPTGNSPTSGQVVIEPGSRVGPLKIGDSEERALELFPKKYEDQQWDDSCGTTYTWADTENTVRGGTLAIRVKKGKVFQIESATTRFHTAEGITALDSPDKVEQDYKDLNAYTLLTAPSAALGSRPLVFWLDKKKGIAFAFAFYPSQHKRYLYKIIVFAPGKTFCPEQETTGSSKWQALAPYSLEPPNALSPEPY
jgi:hypothetical protein